MEEQNENTPETVDKKEDVTSIKEENEGASVPEEVSPYEGLDANLYDERGLKEAEAIQALKSAKESATKKDKQILDLRRIISKGVKVPESADEYDDYQPGEDVKRYYEDTKSPVGQFVQGAMGRINEVAYDKAMTKEQAAAVKDLFNEFMTSVQLFENKSDEARMKRAEWREQVLGKNADHIIDGNKRAFMNYNGFDDTEKQVISAAIERDPVLAGAMNKLRQLAFGTQGNIPTREYVDNGSLPDDMTLAAEYSNPATTDKRREQIILARIKAGRTGSLPV